jgi:O-antigen/teichoic acid export membrane protein
VTDRVRGGAFVRMFGGAVVVQIVLSATSLVVGLILIRRATDQQYAYYVLLINVLLLAIQLQYAFIQPQMIVRMAQASRAERADLIGGLIRDQRRLLSPVAVAIAIAGLLAWIAGLLTSRVAIVVLAGTVAISASLFREFFRATLLAYRLPEAVLKADITYGALLMLGALAATLTPAPAAVTALCLAGAAVVGGIMSAGSVRKFEPWNSNGAPGILRAIAPLGAWTAAGSAIHWSFSQGYNFVVAATLGVTAVAPISATRILIMPVNLLSTGIGTMMLPTISGWLQTRDARTVLRRQLTIAAAVASGAVCYFAVVWWIRDWLFASVLKKQIAQRELLLLLWFAVGLLMLLRDQLVYILLARSRYRDLTILTFVSAVLSLTTGYVGMRLIGVPGALVGVLVGEFVNVAGQVALSAHELRSRAHTSA